MDKITIKEIIEDKELLKLVVAIKGVSKEKGIPAMLSNGESVMTARTTSMFAPILSSFNQMGGGVPISVAESGNQTLGEDMLARSIQKVWQEYARLFRLRR